MVQAMILFMNNTLSVFLLVGHINILFETGLHTGAQHSLNSGNQRRPLVTVSVRAYVLYNGRPSRDSSGNTSHIIDNNTAKFYIAFKMERY